VTARSFVMVMLMALPTPPLDPGRLCLASVRLAHGASAQDPCAAMGSFFPHARPLAA
jgi:hypothetical protein